MSQSIVAGLVRCLASARTAVVVIIDPPSSPLSELGLAKSGLGLARRHAKAVEGRGVLPSDLPRGGRGQILKEGVRGAVVVPMREIARVEQQVVRAELLDDFRDPRRVGRRVE